MPIPDPKLPVRADHRFIKQVLSGLLGGMVEPRPEEFNFVCRGFSELGGSWERIFKGSPDDVALLKRILKSAFKQDMMTKSPDWGGAE